MVRNYLTVFERGIVEDYMNERAEQFVSLAQEAGFTDAATSVDQAPQLTDFFPINYGNIEGLGRVGASSNQTIEGGLLAWTCAKAWT